MQGKRTHGMTGTKIYKVWAGMIFKAKKFGICDEWKEFENFYAWANANGYKEGLCLNRLDHEKGFSPENCRWGKWALEFGSYHCRYLTYNGETHNVTEWAKKLGIKRITLYRRLDKGWTVEEALSTPIDDRKRNLRRNKNYGNSKS